MNCDMSQPRTSADSGGRGCFGGYRTPGYESLKEKKIIRKERKKQKSKEIQKKVCKRKPREENKLLGKKEKVEGKEQKRQR